MFGRKYIGTMASSCAALAARSVSTIPHPRAPSIIHPSRWTDYLRRFTSHSRCSLKDARADSRNATVI
jgi:hypothetical protein